MLIPSSLCNQGVLKTQQNKRQIWHKIGIIIGGTKTQPRRLISVL